MDNNTIGDRVRSLRGRKTLAEFAENLGVGGSQISAIETGRSKMSFELAERICDLYNCTMDWLIRGVGTREVSAEPKVQEADNEFIKIRKDDLILLQQQALRNKDEQINQLLKQVESAKNIEGVVD
ncbi:helix-turn-helix domain-containing protein [Runella sp. CRIBMP]|uniref:helix-turn-helix domain-containing protein n=1 Tax=Runella sp. CRIBMP TaxID=2683261 RepID=UPI0014132B2D|nr:helix-turn-helix domain-containing protein [Runella sp. CRIBMP]NBB18810.1 helix-turn-helix domain-containing protein [Runella sp. CRIBMP]